MCSHWALLELSQQYKQGRNWAKRQPALLVAVQWLTVSPTLDGRTSLGGLRFGPNILWSGWIFSGSNNTARPVPVLPLRSPLLQQLLLICLPCSSIRQAASVSWWCSWCFLMSYKTEHCFPHSCFSGSDHTRPSPFLPNFPDPFQLEFARPSQVAMTPPVMGQVLCSTDFPGSLSTMYLELLLPVPHWYYQGSVYVHRET